MRLDATRRVTIDPGRNRAVHHRGAEPDIGIEALDAALLGAVLDRAQLRAHHAARHIVAGPGAGRRRSRQHGGDHGNDPHGVLQGMKSEARRAQAMGAQETRP